VSTVFITLKTTGLRYLLSSGVGASIASLTIKIRLMSSADSSWLGAQATMCTYVLSPSLRIARTDVLSHRIIETNIALIVGCMPASAQFVSVYIRGSSFIKSLRSRGRTRDASAPSKDVITFGSNQTPRRNTYYELTDTMLLETQATIRDDTSERDHHHAKSSSTQSRVEQAG
jgi:hypothetical protein